MIGYSGDASVAEKLKNTLLASDLVKEVIVTSLGPTIVAHTGSGTIAVFYIAETKRNEIKKLRINVKNHSKFLVLL